MADSETGKPEQAATPTPADMPKKQAAESSDSLDGLRSALQAERKAHREADRDAATLRQQLEDARKQENAFQDTNLRLRVQVAATGLTSDPLLATDQAVKSLKADATDDQIKDALDGVLKAHPALKPVQKTAPVPIVKPPSANDLLGAKIDTVLNGMGIPADK